MQQIQFLGKQTLSIISGLGRAVILLVSALIHVPNIRKGTPLLMQDRKSVV